MSNDSNIPDDRHCFRIMEQWNMLPHIRRHSIMVSRVALCIAEALNASGADFNLAEIQAASLLHDITKTKSIQSGENHAVSGARLIAGLGYPEIADIILQHINPHDGGEHITAGEIVSYADKRVLHEEVVNLDARFAYLLERYGKSTDALRRIDDSRRRAQAIEEKIIAHITLPGFNIHCLPLEA